MKEKIKQIFFSKKFIICIAIIAAIFFLHLTNFVDAATGDGGCVSFCGSQNGTPIHSNACCDGYWQYDACNYTSYCSTGWYSYSWYLPECCSSCSVTSAICDEKDGWYDLNSIRWVSDGCQGDSVKEKEQKGQNYRNYYCAGEYCSYWSYSFRWVDTGETRITTDCFASCKECSNGSCVWPSGTTATGYGGNLSFCGDYNGTPYHANSRCDGYWWYDACGWDSCCSTGFKNYSGYETECCEDCSSVGDNLCPGECSGEVCISPLPIETCDINSICKKIDYQGTTYLCNADNTHFFWDSSIRSCPYWISVNRNDSYYTLGDSASISVSTNFPNAVYNIKGYRNGPYPPYGIGDGFLSDTYWNKTVKLYTWIDASVSGTNVGLITEDLCKSGEGYAPGSYSDRYHIGYVYSAWDNFIIDCSIPAPTLSLTAIPSSIGYNSASILNWSSDNTDYCVASGAWGGAKSTSGSQSTGNLTK